MADIGKPEKTWDVPAPVKAPIQTPTPKEVPVPA